jgi:hypothetical protein
MHGITGCKNPQDRNVSINGSILGVGNQTSYENKTGLWNAYKRLFISLVDLDEWSTFELCYDVMKPEYFVSL